MTSQSVHRARKDEIDAVGALIALSFNDLDADADALFRRWPIGNAYVATTSPCARSTPLTMAASTSSRPGIGCRRPLFGSIARATFRIRPTTRTGWPTWLDPT